MVIFNFVASLRPAYFTIGNLKEMRNAKPPPKRTQAKTTENSLDVRNNQTNEQKKLDCPRCLKFPFSFAF